MSKNNTKKHIKTLRDVKSKIWIRLNPDHKTVHSRIIFCISSLRDYDLYIKKLNQYIVNSPEKD